MSWLTRLFHKETPTAASAVEPVTVKLTDEPEASREQEPPDPAAAAAEAERAAAMGEAAWAGDLNTVRALLDEGMSVDSPGKYGDPILIVAADWGHAPIVETLLARGADPNSANKHGHKALIAALYGGS